MQNSDMLEIDLQLTKDGQVVVSHDNNLLRSTGKDVNISDLNYEELPLLKPVLPVDFAGGNVCRGNEDRKIPLLKDVFQKFQNVPINIDIKNNNELLIKKVNQLIKQYNRENITVWGNFSNEITKKCYEENPNIPLLFSAKRVCYLLFLTYVGLLPFVPLKESCLEILLPRVVYRNPNLVSSFKSRQKLDWFLWLMEKLLMRKELFEHLEKRGIQTYLWVINEDEDFQNAFKLGVTGVMTDYPTRLKEYLQKTQSGNS
ncbi:lysophospholipase D GDPD1-like [Centruroides sculpturatus]|uniref:lysophospholipase D GDPD1-like n=1 Tax=Centruroides sculpturatus TaxID=218467 RepID=UPI000C6CFC38|nr:lysophospholipase D GDPD1-like [Centruroides sculpturatus]